MTKITIAAGAVSCTAILIAVNYFDSGTLITSNDPGAQPATTISSPDGQISTSLGAGTYFTDEFGNARHPSAEEAAELAASFQADIARLTAAHRIPARSKREPSGATSAVVGASKLRYLVVNVSENGEATFGHSDMDEDGNIETSSVNELPEM